MEGPLAKFELHEPQPGLLVLTCRGRLSWEDRELLAATVERRLVGRTALTGLVVDLGGVEFLNSAGLGALLQLLQRVRGRQGRVVFANVPPLIHRVFLAVGLDRLAPFVDGVDDAVTRLSDPAAVETITLEPPRRS